MTSLSIRLRIGLASILLAVPLTGCNQGDSGEGDAASAKAKPVTLTDGNFETQVKQSAIPVLVDFWATWCGPCRQLAPTIDALAGEYAGRMKFGKLDTDRNKSVPGAYRIEGLPTLLIFKDGKVVKKLVGYMEKKELKAAIDDVLGA